MKSPLLSLLAYLLDERVLTLVLTALSMWIWRFPRAFTTDFS